SSSPTHTATPDTHPLPLHDALPICYTAGYPEDAELHVRRAVEEHARIFGRPPKGMWPAEGSVCQPMLPLLDRHGIRWLATDEGEIGRATRLNSSHVKISYAVFCLKK